jgi:hypothetical protein
MELHLNLAIFETRHIVPRIGSLNKKKLPSDRRLSAKLVPTLADKGCRVVSATNPRGR